MNLKQLEAFAEVVERKSFSKAGKALHLTQPTISAHINALEKELNTKLLIRSAKEVVLSDNGKVLYRYAKKMVSLQSEILQEFNLENKRNDKQIVLGASTIPAQYILPQLMANYSMQYPKERFEITENDSAEVIQMLAQHKIEIGLVGTMIANSHYEYIPFYKDKLVLITPNCDKFKKYKTVFPLEQIKQEALILREEGSGTRKEIEKYFVVSGTAIEELNIVASISSQEVIKKSVSNGMGISIISELAAKDYVEEGRILSFDLSEKMVYRNLYIIKNKEYYLSPSCKRFIEYTKKYFGESK